MPTIQTELRVQLPGLQTPFVKRTQIQVDSIATHSFTVPAAPLVKAPARPVALKKAKARKPIVKSQELTVHLPQSEAKFIAFYAQGDYSGFSVKVGGGKAVSLAEPHVLADSASARRAVRHSIVLHNASTAPRTLLVLVGSSLSSNSSKTRLVRGA